LREFLFVSRFGLVGLAATAVHMLIVWLLIEMITVPILVANLIAFLTAFGVSFTGNYVWTFASPGSPKSAMCRFFLISSGAFAANTVILALLARSEWLTPALAALCAAVVIPLITYVASRLWGFKVGRPSV
jgi:putative flippase GtrA